MSGDGRAAVLDDPYAFAREPEPSRVVALECDYGAVDARQGERRALSFSVCLKTETLIRREQIRLVVPRRACGPEWRGSDL